MWKYSAVWILNLILATAVTIGEPQQPVSQDPITAGYNAAQLTSQLTDRGLWLFFLFIILAAAYWNNKSKEREIKRLQDKQDAREDKMYETLVSVENLLERIERKLGP